MFVFYVVLALVIVGGIVYLMKSKHVPHVTVLTIAILVALLAPSGIYAITATIAKNADQTFYEFWNGSEVSATTKVVTCEKDGSCKHEYQCDPYTVYESESYTDSEGKTKYRTVTKTKYHDCPYSTQETDYIVDTTLGKMTIADAVMTGAQYRSNTDIPGGQQTSPPQAWSDAKNRIESGEPLGVTGANTYKNFILAADATLFENYSDQIDKLVAEGMLPTPTNSIHSYYVADKAYSAGETGVDMTSMNRQLQQLNGYVGSELRGDLHMVFVEASRAGDPTDYTNALKAHWTSEAVGKHAIAKNTVTIVVGVEQLEAKPTVAWAKGFTGMPVGNEALIQEFTNLKGEIIDNDFIGSPKYAPHSNTYAMSGGAVEGMISGEHKFARASMSASDEGDNGSGFIYLSDSWEMKPAQKAVAILISSIVSGIILIIGTFISINLGWTARDPLKKLFTKN